MAGRWKTQAFGKRGTSPLTPADLDDEEMVILIQGTNTFGDVIYAYVQMTFGRYKDMRACMEAKQQFSPSDYGTVLAAGTGEPDAETQQEIAAQYQMQHDATPAVAASAAPPMPRFNLWDEDEDEDHNNSA